MKQSELSDIGLGNGPALVADPNETQVLFITQVFRCLESESNASDTERLPKQ